MEFNKNKIMLPIKKLNCSEFAVIPNDYIGNGVNNGRAIDGALNLVESGAQAIRDIPIHHNLRRMGRLLREGAANIPPGSLESLTGGTGLTSALLLIPIKGDGLVATGFRAAKGPLIGIAVGSFGFLYMGCQPRWDGHRSPSAFDAPLHSRYYATRPMQGLSSMFHRGPKFGMFIEGDPSLYPWEFGTPKSAISGPVLCPMSLGGYYVSVHRLPRSPREDPVSPKRSTLLPIQFFASIHLNLSALEFDAFFILVEKEDLEDLSVAKEFEGGQDNLGPVMLVNNIRTRVKEFGTYLESIDLDVQNPVCCGLDTIDDSEIANFPLFVSFFIPLCHFTFACIVIWGSSKITVWVLLTIKDSYLDSYMKLLTSEKKSLDMYPKVIGKSCKISFLNVSGYPVFPFVPVLQNSFETITLIKVGRSENVVESNVAHWGHPVSPIIFLSNISLGATLGKLSNIKKSWLGHFSIKKCIYRYLAPYSILPPM